MCPNMYVAPKDKFPYRPDVLIIFFSRFLFHCLSQWPPHSQVGRVPGAHARNSTNGGGDARRVCVLYNGSTRYKPDWIFVVLYPTVNRPECVGAATYFQFKRPLARLTDAYPLLAVACLAQAFYCHRVAVFTQWKYAVVLIGMVRQISVVQNTILILTFFSCRSANLGQRFQCQYRPNTRILSAVYLEQIYHWLQLG